MASAIELAQRNIPSVVLEKRGDKATRQPVFNVAPAFADRLAALDPHGSLVSLLTPTDRIDSFDCPSGKSRSRTFEGPLDADPGRSRGDMSALLKGVGPSDAPDADKRRWSMVGIDRLENGLRSLARSQYKDLIEIRPNTTVESIIQSREGWVEAVTKSSPGSSTRDALRGAFLIDASGQDLLHGPRTTYDDDIAHFVGAKFPAPPKARHDVRKLREIDGGHNRLTIAIPAEDRTLVWTQLESQAGTHDERALRRLLHDKAHSVGVAGELNSDDPLLPVDVQLWTSDQPAVGRVLKVGDSVRAPYFMTSTGAASALVHDVPQAVDAITAVLAGGDLRQAVDNYAQSVLQANRKLLALVQPQLRRDTT